MASEATSETVDLDIDVNDDAREDFWNSMSIMKDNGYNTISRCSEALYKYFAVDQKLSNIMDKVNHGFSFLLNCEDTLLNLASSDETEGIFYGNILKFNVDDNEETVVRLFEHGCFNGFSSVFMKEMLDNCSVFPVHVFNNLDVTNETTRDNLMAQKRENRKQRKRSAYSRLLRGNKSSVVNSSKGIVGELQDACCGLIIYVLKKDAKFSSKESDDRLLICQRSCEEKSSVLENDLKTYKIEKRSHELEVSIFQDRGNDFLDLNDQIAVINSLPNCHRWLWKLSDPSKQQIKFEQRFVTSSRYLPASPRKRICRAFCSSGNGKDIILHAFTILLGIYNKDRDDPNIPCKRRRVLQKKPRSKIQIDDLCQNLGIDVDEARKLSQNVSIAYQTDTLYGHYVEKIFSQGTVAWRVKRPSIQVILMNDYDPKTGQFKVRDFVHVTAKGSSQGPIISCSCQSFGILESSVKNITGSTSSDWDGLSCCHSRLLSDIFTIKPFPFVPNKESPSLPRMYIDEEKLDHGESLVAKQVIRLEAKTGVKKFSVVAEGVDAGLVTIYQSSKKPVISCHSSLCKSKQGKVRSIDSIMETNANICQHMKKLKEYYDFSLDNDMDHNEEETNLSTKFSDRWKKVFDEELGKWTHHKDAVSKLTVPDNPQDADLKRNCKLRLTDQQNSLIASAEGTCECQAGWVNDTYPSGVHIFHGKTIVYSAFGAVEKDVYGRKCIAGSCVRFYDGKEDSIFRSSQSVACGYEVGWEFVELVMSSEQTFSGYRKVVQSRYERYSSDIDFMAANTFFKWWFSWASAMDINFIESCSSCGSDIKFLAAAGTQLGITLKKTNVKPMETIENDAQIPTVFRHYDRTLISNFIGKENRKSLNHQLLQYCNHVLGKCTLPNEELLDWSTTTSILPVEIKMMIWAMLCDENTHSLEKKAIASFLSLLLKDTCVTNVIPPSMLSVSKSFLQALEEDRDCSDTINSYVIATKCFCPELGDLISTSTKLSGDKPKDYLLSFLYYLIQRSEKIINANTQPMDSATIRKYNPARDGRAYYFNSTGSQIRQVRSFSIDCEEKKNFDDIPSLACNKNYSVLSKKGTTNLFLWFCPAHGHCMGFHLTSGSEGRKDAATSLYAFLERAPDVIFYDFACSLDEYCKNRESGYFNNTHFFHDIFHGYSHKCSPTLESNRLAGFEGINTSICEQFNSFIQCIKASSQLMSQEQFMFYVQFFVHQWNAQRKKLV